MLKAPSVQALLAAVRLKAVKASQFKSHLRSHRPVKAGRPGAAATLTCCSFEKRITLATFMTGVSKLQSSGAKASVWLSGGDAFQNGHVICVSRFDTDYF